VASKIPIRDGNQAITIPKNLRQSRDSPMNLVIIEILSRLDLFHRAQKLPKSDKLPEIFACFFAVDFV
jgi:hypothetical protein